MARTPSWAPHTWVGTAEGSRLQEQVRSRVPRPSRVALTRHSPARASSGTESSPSLLIK